MRKTISLFTILFLFFFPPSWGEEKESRFKVVDNPKSIILMGAKPLCPFRQIQAIVDNTLRCMGVKEQRVPIIIVVHEGRVARNSPFGSRIFTITGKQYCTLPTPERPGLPELGVGWIIHEKLDVYGVVQSDLVNEAPAIVHVAEDMAALAHEIAHIAPHIGGDWGRMAMHNKNAAVPEELNIQACDKIVVNCELSEFYWHKFFSVGDEP
jgi:hypothetical protein